MGSRHDLATALWDHEPERRTRQRLGVRQSSAAVEARAPSKSARRLAQSKTWRQDAWFMGSLVWLFALSSWAQGSNGILTIAVGSPPAPPTALVKHDDLWRYRKGTSAPPTGWQTNSEASLDASWLNGRGGFGYGDDDDATILSDMLTNYTTVYIRRSFEVPSGVATNRHLKLVMDFDDGFVAWLDGAEIARLNAPGPVGTEPAFNADATAGHEASGGDAASNPNPPMTYDLGALGNWFQPGSHVLAVQGLNAATNSSDFSLTADLSLNDAQVAVVDGEFFALVKTNSIMLTGTNTFTNSVRVTVNGGDATYDPASSTWFKVQTLAPGINHVSVRAMENAGGVVAVTNKIIAVELASTFLGGTLAGDTTWSASMGIIHLTNTVNVPAGSSLSIEGGSVLLLAAGVSLQATNAVIRVNGTAGNPVYFLPADGSTVWGGLVASGTNANLLVRHAETVAGHVELLEGAVGVIEDSYLHDYFLSSPPIIHTLRAASFTERRCHVARYHEHLIQRTPVLIEDCLCENITGDGIDFDGALPGSTIRRCTIRRGDITNVDGVDIGNFADGTPSRGVVIEDCLIYEFAFDKGVSIGERAEDITVRNCVIYGVESGIAVKDSSVATIYNNTIVSSDYGLRLYEKIAGQGGGHATAYNNILWENTNSISLANGSTITVNHSDISGTGLYPGADNLNADPLFLDPARRDYRLASNSPCLGIGLDGANLGTLAPVGSLLLDTDGDGLPDPWEWGNGLDFNSAADANLDPDGDGLTNREEYLSGTSPRDPASRLKFDAIGLTGNAVTLRFSAVADKSYTLQYRTAAAQGAWQKFADVAPAVTNRTVELPDASVNQSGVRLYRLVTPAQP